MDRRSFLQSVSVLGLTGITMKLNALNYASGTFGNTSKMPALFLGHGSPMNAIEENEFVRGFREMGKALPRPNAILCVSAHWETRGTWVTAMDKPRTIHDYGGFPRELYQVRYPAPGNPDLAFESKRLITSADVGLDHQWGLDHGCWSVVKHLYPDADIPVIQLSLDQTKDAGYHYNLAKELSSLRNKGVLIVGSGNMVHNLRMVAWDRLNDVEFGYDWAIEAGTRMKEYILSGDHQRLIDYKSQGKEFEMAIPTPEHYLPLLYVLALKEGNEEVGLFNDKAIAGSLTMTSAIVR
ncbi:MAG TPA: 4,5-DOPA dioxygenase extradiol [Bacteroidales bacterium]|nr:4,5-DOPA dioxygenase extradiol [Bacteroidales bacterium]HPM93750.1 4,5-DOPA dioxygenase extradiol [Bacteroidales bacterium]